MAKLDEDGKFNTSDLQDVPDGYELTTVGDSLQMQTDLMSF